MPFNPIPQSAWSYLFNSKIQRPFHHTAVALPAKMPAAAFRPLLLKTIQIGLQTNTSKRQKLCF